MTMKLENEGWQSTLFFMVKINSLHLISMGVMQGVQHNCTMLIFNIRSDCIFLAIYFTLKIFHPVKYFLKKS